MPGIIGISVRLRRSPADFSEQSGHQENHAAVVRQLNGAKEFADQTGPSLSSGERGAGGCTTKVTSCSDSETAVITVSLTWNHPRPRHPPARLRADHGVRNACTTSGSTTCTKDFTSRSSRAARASAMRRMSMCSVLMFVFVAFVAFCRYSCG